MKATAKFYSSNPSSKAKKDAYNKEYNKTKSAVKKRSEANTANRKAGTAGNRDGLDYDHSVKKMVPQSTNRGRAEKSRLKGSNRS